MSFHGEDSENVNPDIPDEQKPILERLRHLSGEMDPMALDLNQLTSSNSIRLNFGLPGCPAAHEILLSMPSSKMFVASATWNSGAALVVLMSCSSTSEPGMREGEVSAVPTTGCRVRPANHCCGVSPL